MPVRTAIRRIICSLLLVILCACNEAFCQVAVEDKDQWETLYEQGLLALDKGHFIESEKALLQALDLSVHDLWKEGATFEALCSLYIEQEKYVEAEKILLDYLAFVRAGDKTLAAGRQAIILSNLANVNTEMSRFDRAEAYLAEAIPIVEKNYGQRSPQLAAELNNLGCAQFRQCKFSAAERHFLQSAEILEKTIGKNCLPYALVSVNLASLYEKLNQHHSALSWYRQAISAFNANLGPGNALSESISRRRKKLARRIRQLSENCKQQSERGFRLPFALDETY